MILPKIKRGFTLIEILLVVAILSILLVVVFAALNPATRLADTRNARRWNDGTVREIVNTGIATACNAVCTGVLATGDCADLETELVTNQAYLGSIPTDPGGVTTDHSEYSIRVNNGIVTIASCSAEGGETISVA